MKSALTGEAEIAARVERELRTLQRTRAKLLLEVTNPVTAERESLATVVEQVREKDLIISQPSSGAATRPLATGERVQLQFATGGGLAAAEARVLGRIKLPSGGKRMFFGYRVSLPTQLQTVERRQHRRIPLDQGITPQVHLMPVMEDDQEPSASLSGQLLDLSVGGVQVKLDGATGPLKLGAAFRLIADFPMPVGSIVHPVSIARIDHDANAGTTRLGLKFGAPVPGMEQFLETLQTRTARRT